MQITIHTERGTFKGRSQDGITADQAEQVKDLIQKCAADGSHFTMDTDGGYVVIGKALLAAAVFVVEG